jgi:hypothetical protein
MSTPQQSIVSEGRQAPVEFLRRGGEVNSVKAIVESGDWW